MLLLHLEYFKKEKNKVLIQQNQINNVICNKLKRNKINHELYSIINIILFYLILILLSEQTLSDTLSDN